jgi:hypothetical protein
LKVLITGVRVNGGYVAALNTAQFMKQLNHRSCTVRGARCIRDDLLPFPKQLIIHTDDYGWHRFIGWRGAYNDASSTSPKMRICFGACFVPAGAINDHINIEASPWQHFSCRELKNLGTLSAEN